VRSSLLTHVILRVYVLYFWLKCALAEQFKPRYCPLWGNSSHQDSHILSPVPSRFSYASHIREQLILRKSYLESSSREQFTPSLRPAPNITLRGISSCHRCIQFPPLRSGHLPRTFLAFKVALNFSFSVGYFAEILLLNKTTITF